MTVDDARMSLIEHLQELRVRLLWAIVATAVTSVACYQFMPLFMSILLAPLEGIQDAGVKVVGTGVAEAFFTKLKLAVIGGIFAASPVIFWQIWAFVAPGLYEHEKRYALPFIFFGTAFFVTGAWFCYVLVFPTAYSFFITQYASISIEPMLRISEYLSFSSRLLLAFGVVFELPVFTFFFARMGMVSHRDMIAWWQYAILGIFIVAAVLTPGPDVASQMLMAGPLLVLYVLSIGVAWAFGKKREEPEDESGDEDENADDDGDEPETSA